MNTVNVEVLTDRLAKIAETREALNVEEAEINAALMVFNRYAGHPAAVKVPATKIAPPVISEDENKLGPPRPAKIPTLFQMAYEMIADAEQRGEDGLSGQGIVEAIGKRYWPGVKGPQILPSIYGFAKHGRLRKSDNGLFNTVRKNEAPTGKPEGASKVTEEAGASSKDQTDEGLFG